MDPILESFVSLDDLTVCSCEPSSLKAALDAIKYVSHKVGRNRIKIRNINVKYLQEPKTRIPENIAAKPIWDVRYQVVLGFHIGSAGKSDWYNATVVMYYSYCPGSCSSGGNESIGFTKQVGNELVPFTFDKEKKEPEPEPQKKFVLVKYPHKNLVLTVTGGYTTEEERKVILSAGWSGGDEKLPKLTEEQLKESPYLKTEWYSAPSGSDLFGGHTKKEAKKWKDALIEKFVDARMKLYSRKGDLKELM